MGLNCRDAAVALSERPQHTRRDAVDVRPQHDHEDALAAMITPIASLSTMFQAAADTVGTTRLPPADEEAIAAPPASSKDVLDEEPHEVLGVAPDAPAAAMKGAYRVSRKSATQIMAGPKRSSINSRRRKRQCSMNNRYRICTT